MEDAIKKAAKMSLHILSDEDKDQKYFTLKLVHGQVIKEHMWSESHVSGGGTGIDGRNRSVQTSTSRKREFVVRTPDEREVHFDVSADKCKISEGQYVTIVLAEKGKKELILSVVNYTQDNVSSQISSFGYGMMTYMSKILMLSFLVLFLPGSCVWGAVASDPGAVLASMTLFLIALPVLCIMVVIKGQKVAKKVDAVVQKITDNISLKDLKSAMADAAS